MTSKIITTVCVMSTLIERCPGREGIYELGLGVRKGFMEEIF